MTDDSADFFQRIAYTSAEGDIPEGIERDQWKRPLIVQPDGSKVAYTRASSFSGYIENKFGLHIWQKRLLARGMGQREDLAALAAALPPAPTGQTSADKRKKTEINAELDEIIERALDTAGAYLGADYGTAIHAFTDPLHPSGPVPERMQEDVRSYVELIEAAGIFRYASELFVVNDELKVAGTLDGLFAVPALACAVVGDVKTGKQNLHSTAIQVSLYSRSKVYDPATGQRMSLQDYTAAVFGQLDLGNGPAFNPEIGIYIHIPKGEGSTTLHPLNLNRGWEMALICAQVRDYQQSGDFAKADAADYLIQNREAAIAAVINACNSVEELRDAYAAYRWCWTEELNKAGVARMTQIGASRG